MPEVFFDPGRFVSGGLYPPLHEATFSNADSLLTSSSQDPISRAGSRPSLVGKVASMRESHKFHLHALRGVIG